jgi:hypothetical protein
MQPRGVLGIELVTAAMRQPCDAEEGVGMRQAVCQTVVQHGGAACARIDRVRRAVVRGNRWKRPDERD